MVEPELEPWSKMSKTIQPMMNISLLEESRVQIKFQCLLLRCKVHKEKNKNFFQLLIIGII